MIGKFLDSLFCFFLLFVSSEDNLCYLCREGSLLIFLVCRMVDIFEELVKRNGIKIGKVVIIVVLVDVFRFLCSSEICFFDKLLKREFIVVFICEVSV